MTDNQGGEAAAVETTPAAPEAAVSSQETERDYEAEARAMGWVPEEEFKGDKKPKKFLPAEEFVERGEHIIPILTKRLKDQEATFKTALDGIKKVNEKTLERQQKAHEKELAELKAGRREAVKNGNVELVERYDAAIEAEKESAPDTKDAKTDNEATQRAWMKENPWFEEDFEMHEFAIKFSEFNAKKFPGISLEDNAKAATAEVRKKFPEKFGGKSSANGHALVDGGGSFGGAPPKADPLSKLPAEVRAQAKSDLAKYPKIYPNADAWLKVYNS